METSSVPADFFPEVQTKVPSIETTTRPSNKDDGPAQARPSLGPISPSQSPSAVATEGIKTTASVDDVTAVLPALETRDDIVTTTAEEKDDDVGHDIKREAVTTAAAKEDSDGSDVVAQQAVELEPAALIAEEAAAAAVPDDEKSAVKKSTPVIVVSSSARGFEPTSSNVGEATPILPTTTVQKEAFPMPTSLPPDDLGRRRFGKINQKGSSCSSVFLATFLEFVPLEVAELLNKFFCLSDALSSVRTNDISTQQIYFQQNR